jgi:hypothetical protein
MEMITPIKEYWEPDHPQIFMTNTGDNSPVQM